jgi:hypothetical protein
MMHEEAVMHQAIVDARQFGFICHGLLAKFSSRFPDKEFNSAALRALRNLLAERKAFPGAPGGWAGGIVYAISRHRSDLPHPIVLNAELEEIFGASMGTIRKRAEQLWSVIYPGVEHLRA